MTSPRVVREKSKQVRQRASQTRSECRELRSLAASTLYASRQLIVSSCKAQHKATALKARSTDNIVSALKADSQVGLTFAAIASQARDTVKGRRNQANARLAYDTVRQKAQTTPLSETGKTDIDSQLTKLRTALQHLGEAV